MENESNPEHLVFKDPKFLEEIYRNSRKKMYKRDDVFINPGDLIVFIPLVLKGCIRVIRQDIKGDEIFLYHLYPGQTCAMSLACCQSGSRSMIKAVAEDATELLQIPVNLLEQWFIYPEWRAFITNNYYNRFTELLEVIDLIAFSHMDTQLLHYIQERCKANQTKVLIVTHQQIADELHTHREAITRLLKTMENKGLIGLGRNKIELF